MKTIDCAQGSTAWMLARLGVVTASEVGDILTPAFAVREGKTVETYMFRKLAEKVMGYSGSDGSTFAMDQGSLIEKIAIPWFEFSRDVTVQRVGFCLSDDARVGCSPDGLIGDDNGLEVKSPQPPAHIKYLLHEEVPPQYLAQLHFSMFVTGRPRWTFISYSRHMPSLVIEVKRDEAIQAKIQDALYAKGGFFDRFDDALAMINRLRENEGAKP